MPRKIKSKAFLDPFIVLNDNYHNFIGAIPKELLIINLNLEEIYFAPGPELLIGIAKIDLLSKISVDPADLLTEGCRRKIPKLDIINPAGQLKPYS